MLLALVEFVPKQSDSESDSESEEKAMAGSSAKGSGHGGRVPELLGKVSHLIALLEGLEALWGLLTSTSEEKNYTEMHR